jgi:hypothetical protein
LLYNNELLIFFSASWILGCLNVALSEMQRPILGNTIAISSLALISSLSINLLATSSIGYVAWYALISLHIFVLRSQSARRHKRLLREYMENGSNRSLATRVLALLVESGVAYIFFWVCSSFVFDNVTAKLRYLQTIYVVSSVEATSGNLNAVITADVSSTILVCPLY